MSGNFPVFAVAIIGRKAHFNVRTVGMVPFPTSKSKD